MSSQQYGGDSREARIASFDYLAPAPHRPPVSPTDHFGPLPAPSESVMTGPSIMKQAQTTEAIIARPDTRRDSAMMSVVPLHANKVVGHILRTQAELSRAHIAFQDETARLAEKYQAINQLALTGLSRLRIDNGLAVSEWSGHPRRRATSGRVRPSAVQALPENVATPAGPVDAVEIARQIVGHDIAHPILPPFLFMTRISGPPTFESEKNGEIPVRGFIEAEYDIPPDAWYFRANGGKTMPYGGLPETTLQPAGRLALSSFSGVVQSFENTLIRNLDGKATVFAEVAPGSGTLSTRAELTSASRVGSIIIATFDHTCRQNGVVVCKTTAVFGLFPREALVNQVGLPVEENEESLLEASPNIQIDLRRHPAEFLGGSLGLASPPLLMIDRITGYRSEGGKSGLGALRAEKEVQPDDWFFKAHFYEDPVQPGSLAIEALIQMIQFYMLKERLHAGMVAPRFEPIAIGSGCAWRYRGQVLPANKTITTIVQIHERKHDGDGALVSATGTVFVFRMIELKLPLRFGAFRVTSRFPVLTNWQPAALERATSIPHRPRPYARSRVESWRTV